eukprot:3645125-Rhodomonas_salina.1
MSNTIFVDGSQFMSAYAPMKIPHAQASEQPDFPPLSEYECKADPHTFCGIGSPGGACKECQNQKVQFQLAPSRPMGDFTDQISMDDLKKARPEFYMLNNNDTFSATESSDGEACENSFDSLKTGEGIDLAMGNKTARRKMPIGGSRLVVGHLGASTGQVIWRVRIDRCGLDERMRGSESAEFETASRMIRTNVHGVKVGVAQKGANLKWFAGFDQNSHGLDCQGDVWSEGKPIKTHLIDGGGRRGVCFKEGDVVSVIIEFNCEKPTLKYAVNDVPLAGAYYLSSYTPGQDLYVAVSLLWPGEQVTFLSEELYE